MINKGGGTLDRVNHELDKVDEATDSAVDAVQAVDKAVRAVSCAVTTPVTEAHAGVVGRALARLASRRSWSRSAHGGRLERAAEVSADARARTEAASQPTGVQHDPADEVAAAGHSTAP